MWTKHDLKPEEGEEGGKGTISSPAPDTDKPLEGYVSLMTKFQRAQDDLMPAIRSLVEDYEKLKNHAIRSRLAILERKRLGEQAVQDAKRRIDMAKREIESINADLTAAYGQIEEQDRTLEELGRTDQVVESLFKQVQARLNFHLQDAKQGPAQIPTSTSDSSKAS